MASLAETEELLGFLKAPKPELRRLASEHVLALTGTGDGVDLLIRADAAKALCILVGDSDQDMSRNAVAALINLSDRPKAVGQMLKAKLVGVLMEGLKSADCTHKRINVMLLANMSQTHAACVQLMSLHEADSVLVGMHLRRLIQWFVQAPPGEGEDTFEYCGEVLRNVCTLKEARAIVMDTARGILQVLLPQLQSSSLVRRRGVAGALRHCAFETELVPGLLAPALKVVESLVLPLAGPELYEPEDTLGMPLAWFKDGRRKAREPHADVRRLLTETLLLLAASREAREHMRSVKVYPVLKALHEWIDAECRRPAGAPGESTDLAVAAAVDEFGDLPLLPDDDATVDAIIKIVDFLLREEEEGGGEAAASGAGEETAATGEAEVESGGEEEVDTVD